MKHFIDLRTKRRKTAHDKAAKLRTRSDSDFILPPGSKVYLHPELPPLDTNRCVAYAKQKSMKVQREPVGADVVVAPMPGQLDRLTQWAITLCGGVAVDPGFFMNMHGERTGSCIAYMAAIMSGGTRARPRLFWASPGFRRAHPDLYSCLSRAAKVTGSVWRE
eukprot:15485355-Alexandrium_andersonii.AAC.1